MDSKGFSLLQVIFASSVVGVLTLAGVKMMREQQQLAKLTSQRFEEKYILYNMRRVLADSTSCRETFSGLDSKSASLTYDHLVQVFTPVDSQREARLFLYRTYPSSKKLYGNENVRIHKIELKRAPQQQTRSFGQLHITFDRGPLFHDKRLHQEKIPLQLRWDTQGKLKSCSVWVERVQDNPYWKTQKFSQSISLTPKTFGPLVIKKGHSQKTSLPAWAQASTLTGTLRAQAPKRQNYSCQREYKGALIYDKKEKKLFTCTSDGQWQAVGEAGPQLNSSKEFTLGAQQIETQVTQALICSVERAENLPISAQCELKSPQGLPANRPNIDPGTWKLRLSGQAKPQSKCVYRCYF